MKIRYLGHSCFVLESEGGTRAVTDPYGAVGFRMPPVSADIVTVSHSHYDHNHVSAVGGSPAVLERAGEYEIGGISVSAVPSWHDDVRGAKRGANLIFRFLIDGINVCHLGDLGEPCTPARVSSIIPADVLLIPVGGVYTIGAAAAKEYVEKISPRIVIPMHYGAAGLNIALDPPERFLGLFGGSAETRKELVLSRETIPEKGTKIILLERSK